MRTHGWGGEAPPSDDEAVARILRVTGQLVDSGEQRPSLLQVAKTVGVTRQTVYRYFASTEDLLRAAAQHAAADLVRDVAEMTKDISDISEAVVEGIACTLELLRANRRFALLFSADPHSEAVAAVTSSQAIFLGRSIVDQYDVDWTGWTESDRDELVEHMLRTLLSFILDPGSPPRAGPDLRRYLRRWSGVSRSFGSSPSDSPIPSEYQ